LELPSAILTYPIWHFMEPDYDAIPKSIEEINKSMISLNNHLLSNMFLATNRVTLADITVAFALIPLFIEVFDLGYRRGFQHLMRWFETVLNQRKFKETFGEVVYCQRSPYDLRPSAIQKPQLQLLIHLN